MRESSCVHLWAEGPGEGGSGRHAVIMADSAPGFGWNSVPHVVTATLPWALSCSACPERSLGSQIPHPGTAGPTHPTPTHITRELLHRHQLALRGPRSAGLRAERPGCPRFLQPLGPLPSLFIPRVEQSFLLIPHDLSGLRLHLMASLCRFKDNRAWFKPRSDTSQALHMQVPLPTSFHFTAYPSSSFRRPTSIFAPFGVTNQNSIPLKEEGFTCPRQGLTPCPILKSVRAGSDGGRWENLFPSG